jgi:hypothetical protein
VEERIRMLVEQLLSSNDLRTVQNLAVELQWAVYEQIEELRRKQADEGRDPPDLSKAS